MPTYERSDEFNQDYAKLTAEQRLQFQAAVGQLVEDLRAKRRMRPSLRVKRFQKRKWAYELSWAGDGRALFTYGTSPHPGDVHIVWLAVGTHDIYKR